MPLISEKYHKDKLNKLNINIKTKYIVGNKILERNTDDSHNDDIVSGIRCQKDYYLGKSLVHTEKLFDSRIEYTYISKEQEDRDYKCPNCGMNGKIKDFIDGCPYCRTHYNIDYVDKDLGSKYHYDRILKNKTYRIITAIIDIIISLILSFIFIKLTSRTFNNYDILKIFIYGLILSLVLYYFFYIADAYIILSPIKSYKDKINKKQIDFWNRTKIDKKTFFNNLNYDIRKKYFSKDNVVDYDILDYMSFDDYEQDDGYFVKVSVDIRVIYFENNKIFPKYINDTYIMKKNNQEQLVLKDGINFIKCPSCGASIDATKGYCTYCRKEIKSIQEWIMEDN